MTMKPLAGLRIADFTLHAAGPFFTHLLSMLGAECIKIESALRPDIFRKPHPVYGRFEVPSFDQVSANKLSVTLNLKHPRGLDLARRLVAVSDVVAESFRPGVMERLGLGYEEIRKIKPDIVMASLSASGQTGPESRFAGYAPLFSAWGGLGYLTGYEDGPPVEIRHVMDHSSGLAAATATLAAIYRHRTTGEGQHVDIAARDVASSFIGEALLDHAVNGRSDGRQGNDDGRLAPHGAFRCEGEDAWVTIAVGTDEEWRGLANVMGRPDWLGDPRFADGAARWRHRAGLAAAVSAWTSTRDRHRVADALQAAGVPAFPSLNAHDIVTDTHLAERGVIQEMAGPGSQRRAVVGPPWRLSRTPGAIERWTPRLGQDNDYVLGELLGLSRAYIDELVADQAVY